MNKKKIAVVGISRGAGATYVASTLAFLMSVSKFDESCEESAADIEYFRSLRQRTGQDRNPQEPGCTFTEFRQPQKGEPLVYHEAGLDRNLSQSQFTDFISLYLDGKWPQRKEESKKAGRKTEQKVFPNVYKNINWAVYRNWADVESSAEAQALSMFPLDFLPGSIVIADSPPIESLPQYNLILGVIDPAPAAVYAGAEVYEKLKDCEKAGVPVLWILNKDCEEVDHSALKRFLKLKTYYSLPEVSRGIFCRAQYACRLPAEVQFEEEKNTPGMKPGALENFKNVIMQQLLQR